MREATFHVAWLNALLSVCHTDIVRKGERERGTDFPPEDKWELQLGVCSELFSGSPILLPLTPQSTSWVALGVWLCCLNWCPKFHVTNICSPEKHEEFRRCKSNEKLYIFLQPAIKLHTICTLHQFLCI